MKLYWYDERAKKCVDKYMVREYLSNLGFSNILINLVGDGTYKNTFQINYSALPNRFVIKTTHDSGNLIIVSNKHNHNLNKINKLNRKLHINYSYIVWRMAI
jgi:hypothetical protein